MAKSRTLGTNPRTFENELRSHFDEEIASVRATAGTEAANKRRITLQVMDRVKKDWSARFVLEVWLQATAGGDPSATGNTVAWVTGNVIETILPMGHWRVVTNSSGSASFDLTIAGAATRYVGSLVVSMVKVSEAIEWEA